MFLQRITKLAICAILAATLPQSVSGQGLALQPAYWAQRVFLIPYRDTAQAGLFAQNSRVELLMSRDGTNGWRVLQAAERNVQGFSFHAPEDGEYWFAVRDAGSQTDNRFISPQLRVTVDTLKPMLELRAMQESDGSPVLRYEANDRNLRAQTLVIEQRTGGSTWQRVNPGRPEVAQPDRLIGRAVLNAVQGAGALEVRATVSDAAGNRVTQTTQLGGNQPGVSQNPSLAIPLRGPLLPTIDWPTNGKSLNTAPPARNSYNTGRPINTPQRADKIAPPPQTLFASRGPAEPALPRNGLGLNIALELGCTSPQADLGNGWESPQAPTGLVARSVNTESFELDYELDSVGPWGVSRVEVWGSPDGGRSWSRYAVDPDNRSPARVVVPGAGTFGFTLVVDGANGVAAPRPKPGDTPEIVVSVDTEPPLLQLRDVRLGQGNLTGHLQISWSATDTNLEQRPVGLYFSSSPSGPWSTIATGLENSGAYTWRLARHVPDSFYVRLEVRDTAGNVGIQQTQSPVTLNRPRPTGRLRGARPSSGWQQGI